MLTVYRRHREKCKFADDRISMKCRCPLWGKGMLEGEPYQKSLKTRSFERAQQIIREIEDGKRPEEKHISIKTAGTFPIPIALVPGHLNDEDIDASS